MLMSTSTDIICVNESHPDGDNQTELKGHLWCGFNCCQKLIKAPIMNGGAGFFLKTAFICDSTYPVIDKCFDVEQLCSVRSESEDCHFKI